MSYLRLLGGASIESDHGTLTGPAAQRHRLALLALLASAHPRGLRREKLVGYLWPAKDAGRGRNLLNQATYHLRRAVGEEAIVSSGDELKLDAGVLGCDVLEYEDALDGGRWREAVERYGGLFLDGFHLSGAVEFERWTDAERRRLSGRHRGALEKLGERAEDEGRPARAVAWWRRRADAEPLNSRVALRLIEAMAAAGNVAGALERAREHESLLRAELGVPPPDEIRSLVRSFTGPEGGGDPRGGPPDRPGRPAPRPGADREGAGGGVAGGSAQRGPEPRTAPGGIRGGAGSAREREDPGRVAPARRALLWSACLVGLLAVTAAGWVLWDGDEVRTPEPLSDGPGPPSIVVLPFENLGTPDVEHFADGMTEELIVRLASVSGLDVVARTSALQYREGAAGIPRIGEELDVDYALEGTVRWEDAPGGGSRVRVTPQLVRTSDGTHLWADSYDRNLDELFAVQDEIADRVVRELDPRLPERAPPPRERRPTSDLEAYGHYLQANAYLARQFSADAVRDAIAQYERAVELDPEFAAAWRRLIHARLWLAWVLDDEEQGLRARADLERLVASGADSPEVRLARGWYLYYGERSYEEALREFEAVRRIRPGDAGVIRVVGLLHQRLGRTEGAVAAMEDALELSPRDAELAFALGRTLHWAGRYAEALHYYDRALALAPDEDDGFLSSSLEHLHLALGDTSKARQVRERARAAGAGAWHGGRAELYARDFHDAADRIRELPAPGRVSRLFRHDNLASAYGRIGDDRRRVAHADSLLELASRIAPESWDRPRTQAAGAAWIFAGLAHIHLGEVDAGLARVRRGLELERSFDDALVGPYVEALAARAYVRAGRHDAAVDLLRSVRTAPGILSLHDLRRDPEWDPLRDDAGFRRLVNQPGDRS